MGIQLQPEPLSLTRSLEIWSPQPCPLGPARGEGRSPCSVGGWPEERRWARRRPLSASGLLALPRGLLLAVRRALRSLGCGLGHASLSLPLEIRP